MTVPTPLYQQQAWWRSALEDTEAAFDALPDVWQPQVGFYRISTNMKRTWHPVAIWMLQPTDDNGDLVGDETLIAKVRNKIVTDQFEIDDLWLKAMKNPVSYEAYAHALEHGTWADDKPAKVRPEPEPKIIAAEAPALFT